MASVELFPSVGNNADTGNRTWEYPERVTAEDGVLVLWNGYGNEVSYALYPSNFGFTIPVYAIIDGIEVSVKKRKLINPNVYQDHSVNLTKNGVNAVGVNKALSGTWPESLTWFTYGGPTDLWGTTWTAAEINNQNFGVFFKVKAVGATSEGAARVDAIKIKVYYTLPSPPKAKIWNLWIAGVQVISNGSLVSPLPTISLKKDSTFNVQAVLRNDSTTTGNIRLRITSPNYTEQILGPVTLAGNTSSSTLTSANYTMPVSDVSFIMIAEHEE